MKGKTVTKADTSPIKLDSKQLLHAYKCMLGARKVDDKAIILYKQNKCHFQIGCAGHEAVQVAAGMVTKPAYDWAYPYYRDMAFCTTWGMTNREHLLSILNKAADPNSGGRQMPMHYGHKALNIVSQSSPTGTQFLQAVGAAFAVRHKKSDAVIYVSAGEGTTSQGDYHEALNWAARELLPVIFLIQNNKFAISVHISEQIAGSSVANISSGYEGLEVVSIDGRDFLKSYAALSKAVDRARKGNGPTVIDAEVVRLQSHSISDNQAKYRTPEEIAEDRRKDPIPMFADYLIREKIASAAELAALERSIEEEVQRDATWAEAQTDPTPETCEDHLLAVRDPGAAIVEKPATGEEVFLVDALNHALDEEMAKNPQMLIFGQDVAHGKGGVFSVTTGLTKKYGKERVFNSPLAEATIVGTAIGIATVGYKPVCEIQFGDYIWTAMMQIKNELSMMRYRSNGAFSCPAVVRVAVGGYIHGGLYHSQNIEAIFSHVPGLLVVYPSNATDAKGLLKSAIRADDPVLFLEHKGLYRQVYAKGREGGVDDIIPMGRAKVVREGNAATIVTWGALVHRSLNVAKRLSEEGVQVEVIDLRTIVPFDRQCVLKSVKKTHRVLIAYEDNLFMGFGAEVSAQIAESAFSYLDAPIGRVAARNVPIPHAPALEDVVLPQESDVEKKLRDLLAY